MDLSFYGATKEVTGSCYYLQTRGKKFLVDCGLQQGQDEKDQQRLPFDAGDIGFVALSHAHIDHSGKLPLLVKEGFEGKIYATKATCELIAILLRDSAHIQEMDAQWENKKAKRSGKKEIVPLYSIKDVENTLKLLVPCKYGEMKKIGEGIKVNFVDAGHILGSASVEIFLSEGEENRKIVFSGDIGNMGQPIIKDPQYIMEADYVVMEATYGDRDHKKHDFLMELAGIIDETISRGGNVIIPSFAVGRTQGLLYLIREMKEKGLVSSPDFPVYVDSPLASRATKLYEIGLSDYGDWETTGILKEGLNPINFSNLVFTDSTEESIAINHDPVPKVIISSSGMIEGGRIRHHLKHNIWNKKCAVVFVGYQAYGTMGRMLLDGTKKVKLFKENIRVAASIYNFTGLSAHADRTGLLKWINSFNKKPDKVFIVHGEEHVCDEFAETLNKSGFRALIPLYKEVYDLTSGKRVTPGIKLQKGGAVSIAYADLLKANEHLLEIIQGKKGAEKKELKKLAAEIQALANNWDR